MNIDLLTTLLTILAATITTFSMTVFYKEKKSREHLRNVIEQEYKLKSDLEKIRYDIERQVYSLNTKMLSNEDRWKDVNHLLISSQNNIDPHSVSKIDNLNKSSFLKKARLNLKELSLEKDLVFFLTPFHEDQLDTYNTIYKLCTGLGLRFKRGDEVYLEKQTILTHILENMIKSRLIIANIDGRNPNVYYELGIAHALDKPTILIAQDINNVPFDLQSQYIILYKDQSDLENKLQKALVDTILNS
ncbi:TIR domain-containing protein [Bacillus cereus]|uniref:hypothetical protein n=1 Tax=Bacillus cereus TaxID=1396 RepID=UPI001D0F3FB7|nr:hypothetical protein [Bacillus cereus]MCC2384759.1 hypothetical protein [Bacillus cereus]